MNTHEHAPTLRTPPLEQPLPIEVVNSVQALLMRLWVKAHTFSDMSDSLMAWGAESEDSPAAEFRRIVENDPDAVQELFDTDDVAEKTRRAEQLFRTLLIANEPHMRKK